jgi:hypothetical protein
MPYLYTSNKEQNKPIKNLLQWQRLKKHSYLNQKKHLLKQFQKKNLKKNIPSHLTACLLNSQKNIQTTKKTMKQTPTVGIVWIVIIALIATIAPIAFGVDIAHRVIIIQNVKISTRK